MANAAQPASLKSEQGKTNFGGSVVDGNRVALNGNASWFQTQDVTATTNLVSPQTVTTGTVVPLQVPANATILTITAVAQAVLVSEVSGTSSLSQSDIVPSGQTKQYPVARLATVYLLGSGGSATVYFYFSTV